MRSARLCRSSACLSVYGARPTGLGYAVAGYGLVLAVVQLRLVPRYLGLPFLPGVLAPAASGLGPVPGVRAR